MMVSSPNGPGPDIVDGFVDGLLVSHQDRLHRRPIELEHFFSVIDRAGIARHVRTMTSNSDFGIGDGIFAARIVGAMAAKESADKSWRVADKAEEKAAAGLPHKSGIRPFGYEPDCITIRDDEAVVYRHLVARFLAGESTRSLAIWLETEQVPTVTGGSWQTTTIKNMLTSPRYAGLRTHRRQVVGPGKWEPNIAEDDHRRVLSRFEQAKTSGRRTPQRYLFSGMLLCGKCGNRLFSRVRLNSRTGESTRRYVCNGGPDHGGCGKLTVVADPLERLIADGVLFRLDTPELADALAGRSSADERLAELTAVIDRAQAQLDELSAAYGNGDVSMREWQLARQPLRRNYRWRSYRSPPHPATAH